MDYGAFFRGSLETLKAEGRYRYFADIWRVRGSFPDALRFAEGES